MDFPLEEEVLLFSLKSCRFRCWFNASYLSSPQYRSCSWRLLISILYTPFSWRYLHHQAVVAVVVEGPGMTPLKKAVCHSYAAVNDRTPSYEKVPWLHVTWGGYCIGLSPVGGAGADESTKCLSGSFIAGVKIEITTNGSLPVCFTLWILPIGLKWRLPGLISTHLSLTNICPEPLITYIVSSCVLWKCGFTQTPSVTLSTKRLIVSSWAMVIVWAFSPAFKGLS